jgi:S-adenosylmethionine:tRNA ribosyltransferase-isomerase
MDRLADYDYELPTELIASHPAERRDQARLLVVHRDSGRIEHRSIADLPEYLRPGDALVLNDTRVLPARLFGVRTATGGKWEGLFLRLTDQGDWQLLSQTKGKLQPGETVTISPAYVPDSPLKLDLVLKEKQDDGIWTATPQSSKSHIELLQQFGALPLPPYIKKTLANETDDERYQTTYGVHPGSVAAPTAGLHFTPELLDRCRAAGAETHTVTLHVGIGTFRPITAEKLDEHIMHAEWCELSDAVATKLRNAKESRGRVVAVGTTSVRTLESAARSGTIQQFCGETNLFIRPPYEFRAVDVLLTNFHLPKSSLLVLVSTFAGRELIRAAYAEAIRENYRFFSYGDAMLLV